jgi:hypothetical protein
VSVDASPKNDIIIAWPKEWDHKKHMTNILDSINLNTSMLGPKEFIFHTDL